ncbi:MAG: hypothetical protein ACRDTC_02900 [Pseudonocardiaceae bacterium]
MPDSDDDLATRVAVLEREFARLRERVDLASSDAATARADAGASRMLAAGADHDVSEVRAELRAHTQSLNALRETQLEQAHEMREGFAKLATGLAQITALLTNLGGSEDTGEGDAQ